MTTPRNQLAYQEAAVGNASVGELVVTLHDILSRDLHAAIAALDTCDIETVAAKLKHGYLALARLEGALNLDEPGTEKIAHFYGMAREQMLQAQAQRDPSILRQLAGLVGDMRSAWVEVQGRVEPAAPSTLTEISNMTHAVAEISAAGWKA
jgi:flagellar protein FliS